VKREALCAALSKIEGCDDGLTDPVDQSFLAGGGCFTPVVAKVHPSSGTTNTVVTITGKKLN